MYNGLNRLKAGFYQKAGTEASKEYFEKLSYDLNGNIIQLRRSEGVLQNGIALQVDNLKYDYTGNRLTKITDEQQNPSGYPYLVNPNVIEYDNNILNGNGNMTKHLDKGISSIQYNYLNLPKQITQNTQVTNYMYRADGVKVKKLFGDIETNYLDGFQYKSTKPSEANSGGGFVVIDPNEVAVMKLRIIPTSEGYFDALSNQYIYNYTDHLGNVRLSYSDTNKDGFIQPRQYFTQQCEESWNPFLPKNCIDIWKPGEIVEVNNYYPFGLMHIYTATTTNAYQYKYNGKELQESGMYDYGARFYMPDIGRWGVVDPLTEKMRRFSSYNYAWDNPVMFVDPDGMFATPPDDYIDASGRYLGSDGASTNNIRIINKSSWNNVTEEKGGSISAESTQALQASSSIVTINTTQISTDINNANSETIADQTKERQLYIGLDVTRGDIPKAVVTSIRGKDGINGEATFSIGTQTDKVTGYVRRTVDETNMPALAQAHTHNIVTTPGLTNGIGTSEKDINAAKSHQTTVYSIDSWTGNQKGGNAIHKVTANGVQTNNLGTTTGFNMGQDALKTYVEKQKNP